MEMEASDILQNQAFSTAEGEQLKSYEQPLFHSEGNHFI